MKWSCFGHAKQKSYLERLVSQERLAHAYIFAGPEMIGKRMMAEDMARTLVPRGCEHDVMRIRPTTDEETGKIKDISIDDIRALRSWLFLRPLGGHKVVLIDSAERLGGEAANMLLKMLEEPPSYAHFFLVTGNHNQVIATIASRCERVDFLPVTESEMHSVLANHKPPTKNSDLLYAIAAGRPGLALDLIQNDKLADVAHAVTNLQKILGADIVEKLSFAKEMSDDPAVVEIVGWWLSYVHYRLPQKPHLANLAEGLMDLAHVVSQSHYNRRLAIENFLLTTTIPK